MSGQVTDLLLDWNRGREGALDELMPLVYDELQRLADRYLRRERADHTLEPSALVHEAFLKLIDQTRVQWRGRAHFLGISAQLMRRILVKHARRYKAGKRGGGAAKVTLDENLFVGASQAVDVLALEEGLERLKERDQRQVKIVELRFYAGLRVEEIAEMLDISPSTVHREWRLARAWLGRVLRASRPESPVPAG